MTVDQLSTELTLAGVEGLDGLIARHRQDGCFATVEALEKLRDALAAAEERARVLRAENEKLRTGSVCDELNEAHEAVFQHGREIDRLRGLLDTPVCRLQFPNGSVPGNTAEAAEGWHREYQRVERERDDQARLKWEAYDWNRALTTRAEAAESRLAAMATALEEAKNKLTELAASIPRDETDFLRNLSVISEYAAADAEAAIAHHARQALSPEAQQAPTPLDDALSVLELTLPHLPEHGSTHATAVNTLKRFGKQEPGASVCAKIARTDSGALSCEAHPTMKEAEREARAGLLPCPFCGGEWEVHSSEATYLGEAYSVRCAEADCGCMARWFPTKAEAIAAWNRRALSTGGYDRATVEACAALAANKAKFLRQAADMNLPSIPSPMIARDRAKVAEEIETAIRNLGATDGE